MLKDQRQVILTTVFNCNNAEVNTMSPGKILYCNINKNFE